ncbi:MAG TPA: carboxypeptidase-like regulatory domain-containing protein [Saprospiraceae bacterium]|nr:carboxypeptidase-like regulatory domain-containing protein [Saprospiraceae bacterium]
MKNYAVTFAGSKLLVAVLLCVGFIGVSINLNAQVTTSSMVGLITDETKEPLIGATVIAVHQPSGTRYGTVTNLDGRFVIPNMRIGGPYQVTVSYVGFDEQVRDNIFLSLGVAANVNVVLQSSAIELSGVEVVALRNDVFSSDRTGAATNVTAQQLNSFPTLSRRLSDFTRLTPQASGGGSFGGVDNRFEQCYG